MVWKRVLAAVVNVLCVSLSIARAEIPPSRETVAMALPLTGALAFLGQGIRDGVALYSEKNPDFPARIRLVTEDTTTAEIGRAISATRRLMEIERPAALILSLSPLIDALRPDLENAQLPTFAVIGSDAAKGMRYGFKFWIPALREFSVVARTLGAEGYQRVAVVTSEQLAAVQREEGLLQALRERGDETRIAFRIRVSGVEELPSAAVKVAQVKPGAVINLLFNGQAGLFARELKKLGYAGPSFGSVVFSDPAEIQTAAGALRGARYPTVVPSEDFEMLFRSRYGKPSTVGAANGYDFAMILHRAVQELGSLTPAERLAQFIRDTPFSGALGSYRYDTAGFNTFTFSAALVSVP